MLKNKIEKKNLLKKEQKNHVSQLRIACQIFNLDYETWITP